MMNMFCTYEGSREEMLVSYLYGEADAGARVAFESHLAGCAACRAELAALGGVRAGLAKWSPPEPGRVLSFGAAAARPRAGGLARLREMPVWAQAAAAVILIAVSARVANVEVRYDSSGVAVRTGLWGSAAAPQPAAQSVAGNASWRADLTALEQQLRTEFQGADTATAARLAAYDGDARDAEILRRVRVLIDETERRQRNELALRVAEIAREMQVQRAADLQKIQYSLGVIENTTGVAMARQRQLLNNLAVRVSQR
jgi:hypothetical protein